MVMMSEIKIWKKFFEVDLDGLIYEFLEFVEKPACIILSGDVGSGKTTFTKKLVKVVNNNSQVSTTSSPTYNLINEIGKVAHADLYRIESENEIVHLELGLYAEDKDYFIVEWGIPYLKHLKRELGDQYNYFEAVITINPVREIDSGTPTRNLLLRKLS
jgi:tRNA threonylcarbamoyladenosine biosynthesis protein TsaE